MQLCRPKCRKKERKEKQNKKKKKKRKAKEGTDFSRSSANMDSHWVTPKKLGSPEKAVPERDAARSPMPTHTLVHPDQAVTPPPDPLSRRDAEQSPEVDPTLGSNSDDPAAATEGEEIPYEYFPGSNIPVFRCASAEQMATEHAATSVSDLPVDHQLTVRFSFRLGPPYQRVEHRPSMEQFRNFKQFVTRWVTY
jgi:hypothetical protein